MASDQKYKEGDGPFLTWECNNRDELLVFTDRQQCYKARVSDFDDTKASVLGTICPPSWPWTRRSGWSGPASPGTTAASCSSSLTTARWPGWSSPPTRPRPAGKKLTGAYSDKAPLVSAFLLEEDQEMAVYSTEGGAA